MIESDGSCWRDWYRQHSSRLLLYARQWLPEWADAEDAVQAGFVKFWRHKPNATESDVPLLYTTVRCAALDLLKRNARRVRREDQLALEADDAWWDTDSMARQESTGEIRRALERLPIAQREVIVLRVWAELSFAEIAATLDESINTITSRYRYALANLKKLITEKSHERI
ncbi:MAG: sigma-70 family RNA polymerase sigma factor [Verrucomicrobia bacterium]|nr:sigma-70 family RNA polymerase sigma factor [Verrucomicrobiota bacterium]